MGGGVDTGWWKEKKVNRRRWSDWRGVDKWEPAAAASREERGRCTDGWRQWEEEEEEEEQEEQEEGEED